MVDNPLFYQTVRMLNRETDKDLKVVTDATRFGFAAGSHIIPAVVDEFVPGGRALPIVFIPGAKRATPVFLVGLHSGRNRFVDADGRWTADYIPAFVRRYPFIIGEVANADPLICIDDKSSLLSDTRGEALFLADGGQTPLLKNTMAFVAEYMAAAKRSDAFVDLLHKLDLFRPITIDVRRTKDESSTVHGTMTIDVAKLNELSDDDFLLLRKNGALAPIFAHLGSLQTIDKVANAGDPRSSAEASGEIGKDAANDMNADAERSAGSGKRAAK